MLLTCVFRSTYENFLNGTKYTSIIKHFNLYMEDGTLNCKSRLQFAEHMDEFGDPVLSPHNSHVRKMPNKRHSYNKRSFQV